MELRQLIYFKEICKSMNMTVAAKNLYISQPALSISIQKLESELGFPLFSRDDRRIELTTVGREVLALVHDVLDGVDAIHELANTYLDEYAKTIRIGFQPSLGSFLWTIIGDLEVRYPNMTFIGYDLKSSQIKEMTKNGELDLGYVIISPSVYQEFQVHHLVRRQLKILMSSDHPLVKEDVITFDMVKDLNFIRPDSTHIDEQLLALYKNHGKTYKRVDAHELFSVFDIVSKGLGVALVADVLSFLVKDNQNFVSREFGEKIYADLGFISRIDAPKMDIVPTIIKEARMVLSTQLTK